MSAYRDALAVDADSSDERLMLAAEILSNRESVVLFEGTIALHRTGTHILCEVIDPLVSSRRCAMEYEVLVENARRMLEASKLRQLMPALPRKWLVVSDYGTGTLELWRAP